MFHSETSIVHIKIKIIVFVIIKVLNINIP